MTDPKVDMSLSSRSVTFYYQPEPGRRIALEFDFASQDELAIHLYNIARAIETGEALPSLGAKSDSSIYQGPNYVIFTHKKNNWQLGQAAAYNLLLEMAQKILGADS